LKPVTYDKWYLSIRSNQPLEERFFVGEERRCCSFFGCGKTLSIEESLFGTKCTEHQKEKRIDPMDVIKLPIKMIPQRFVFASDKNELVLIESKKGVHVYKYTKSLSKKGQLLGLTESEIDKHIKNNRISVL